MRIFLVRHGETPWNAEKRLQGREDIALNARGREQARELGEELKKRGVRFDHVFTSPLGRAAETAGIIAGLTDSGEVVPDEAFIEMEFGSCSGMTYQEQHEYLTSGKIIEGMEDREAAANRVWNGLLRISEREGDILLVFHGAVMALVLSRIAGREIGGGNFKLKNACVSVLEREGNGLTCAAYNLSAKELGRWLDGEREESWILPPPESGKLYYRTPYVKEFDAVVRTCEPLANGRYGVVLDWTAFYPEGGGQPSDTGTLGAARVLRVSESAERIVHETDVPLEDGAKVHGVLDWDRRYSLMQQHTGEHIFSGLVNRRFGYDNVGFHMSGREMVVDWNGVMTWEQLLEVERQTNEMIWQDLPVLSLWPAPGQLDHMDYRSKKALSGAVRIIEIPGCDICACCGTHVSRTGEIGLVKVLDFIHYKGGVRVTLTAGRCAVEDYGRKQEWMNRLKDIFSVPPEGVVEAAERVRQNESDLRYQMGQMRLRFLEEKAAMRPAADVPLLVFEADLSPDEVRKYCTKLYERGAGSVVMVCSGADDPGYAYAVGSAAVDVRPLGKALNAALDGRGGGSAMMVQGSLKAKKTRIEEWFKDFGKVNPDS